MREKKHTYVTEVQLLLMAAIYSSPVKQCTASALRDRLDALGVERRDVKSIWQSMKVLHRDGLVDSHVVESPGANGKRLRPAYMLTAEGTAWLQNFAKAFTTLTEGIA